MILVGQWWDALLRLLLAFLEGAGNCSLSCVNQRSWVGGGWSNIRGAPQGVCLQLSQALVLQPLKGNEMRLNEYLVCTKHGVGTLHTFI